MSPPIYVNLAQIKPKLKKPKTSLGNNLQSDLKKKKKANRFVSTYIYAYLRFWKFEGDSFMGRSSEAKMSDRYPAHSERLD